LIAAELRGIEPQVIKNLGRIYQQTGVDAYAGFSFSKVYTDKMVTSSIDCSGK